MYIDSFARFGAVRKREQYGSCFRDAISDLHDIDFSADVIPNSISGPHVDIIIAEMNMYCYPYEHMNTIFINQPVIAIVREPDVTVYHAVYVIPEQMEEFRLYCEKHKTEIRWIISKAALL